MLLQIVRSSDQEEQQEKKSEMQPSSSNLQGMPSELFRLLLRLYLSTAAPQSETKVRDELRLVAIICLPMICTKLAPENLLFGGQEDAKGLLNLVMLVLTCAKARIENPSDTNGATAGDRGTELVLSNVEDNALKCLELFGNASEEQPLALTAEQDSEQDETVLSIASIVLSLLIAVF